MRKSIDYAGASWLEVAIPFVNLRPDTQETYKTTFFEINQVFAICSAAFGVNYDWIPKVMSFRLNLSAYDLF
jgi:hypothetical protein